MVLKSQEVEPGIAWFVWDDGFLVGRISKLYDGHYYGTFEPNVNVTEEQLREFADVMKKAIPEAEQSMLPTRGEVLRFITDNEAMAMVEIYANLPGPGGKPLVSQEKALWFSGFDAAMGLIKRFMEGNWKGDPTKPYTLNRGGSIEQKKKQGICCSDPSCEADYIPDICEGCGTSCDGCTHKEAIEEARRHV